MSYKHSKILCLEAENERLWDKNESFITALNDYKMDYKNVEQSL